MKMETTMNELMGLLDRHLAQYESLVGLLDRETEALVKLDVDQLQEISKAKETEALKIRLLITPLTQAIQSAAGELGLQETPLPTLAELASRAGAPWAARLHRCSLALARLKRAVERGNEANRNFIHETLDLMSGSIAILTGAVLLHQQGYMANGQKGRTAAYGPARLSREV